MILNLTRGTTIASEVHFATTGKDRTRGLLGRDLMPEGEALVFPRCRQVHTFGMRFPIDVLFVDKHGRVARAVQDMKPGRLSAWVLRSSSTVELPAGTLEKSGTRTSDEIVID
jgi:uncharacterized membrane protein (UPF0127 family)